jgi:hypothetical protein
MNAYRAARDDKAMPKYALSHDTINRLIKFLEKKIDYVKKKTH